MSSFSYDDTHVPPVPVVPVRLSRPGRPPSTHVVSVVDTGADTSVVPRDLARALNLPVLRVTSIRTPIGVRHVTVHSALVELDEHRYVIDVLGAGDDVLLGRDLLNRWRLDLDGPRQRLTLEI